MAITRRNILRATALTVGAGLGVGFYTWRVEPTWLEVVERPLPVRNLPRNLVGTRVAQLSDLHIGLQVDDQYLKDVFDRVRAMSPEIVVYTGDFTSDHAQIRSQMQRMFVHLALGTRATYGILGNHDYGAFWADREQADATTRLAEQAGVQMLRNEVAQIDGLQIVGMDDLWAGRFDPSTPSSKLDPSAASLALSHNPDSVDEPTWSSYSGWILSGHTHGGQCKPPFLPPPLLPVRNRRYSSGEIELTGGRRLYISRGVGHLLRVRFNARPEVTMFHLVQA